MVKIESDINKKIIQFYHIIKKLYSVKKVLLYGSYAKGTFTKDSDIDVAVVIDETDFTRRIEITSQLYRIASDIDVFIEPKCIFRNEFLHHEPTSILAEIIRTGKVVV